MGDSRSARRLGEKQRSDVRSQSLGWYWRHTFAVNKLWIEIDAAFPFDRIEGNMHTLEGVVIFESLKYAEIKHRPHVEDALLAVVKENCQRIIVVRQDFFHCRIHSLHLT